MIHVKGVTDTNGVVWTAGESHISPDGEIEFTSYVMSREMAQSLTAEECEDVIGYAYTKLREWKLGHSN